MAAAVDSTVGSPVGALEQAPKTSDARTVEPNTEMQEAVRMLVT